MSIDRKYWLDFGEGKKRALDFSGYEIAGNNDLPSQPRFRFFVKFRMDNKVTIMCNGNHIDECDSLIVVDAKCSLSLLTSKNTSITKINLFTQEDRRMYIHGPYFFSTFIYPSDAENLIAIARGEQIFIEWRIEGYASPLIPKFTPIMRFSVSNSMDDMDKWPQITCQEFINNIMNRLGLNESYITEFPLQIPAIIQSNPKIPKGISGLLPDLNTLVSSLYNAVHILRYTRSSNDYRQIMDQVKTSVDALRAYVKLPVHRQELAKEIFVDTGVISNIDPHGGNKAAEDLIEKFSDMLESLYQVASKPAHTRSRPSQGQYQRFRFSPDRSDAEFTLEIGLALAKYLIEKALAVINHGK